jgi:hypothetical protein
MAGKVLGATITWSGRGSHARRPKGRPTRTVAHATHLDATCDSIHCHVWTQVGLLELPLHCRTRLGSFEIEAVWRSGMENIVVLRKHGDLVVEDGLAGVSPP